MEKMKEEESSKKFKSEKWTSQNKMLISDEIIKRMERNKKESVNLKTEE